MKETARLLSISPSLVYAWIQAGTLGPEPTPEGEWLEEWHKRSRN